MTVHGFAGYASDAPVPSLLQILNGEKPTNSAPIRVDTKPGTIWRYAGGGYVVAQLLLQDVTGEPFPKLMHDTVLAPIGMTRSTYEQPPKDRMGEVAMPTGRMDSLFPVARMSIRDGSGGFVDHAIGPRPIRNQAQQALAGTTGRVLSLPWLANAGTWSESSGWPAGGRQRETLLHPRWSQRRLSLQLGRVQPREWTGRHDHSDSGGQLHRKSCAPWHEYGGRISTRERTLTKVDAKGFDGYIGSYS
jgi:CubicO group peptidase (beta-lactamase class C family)